MIEKRKVIDEEWREGECSKETRERIRAKGVK